MHVCLLQPLTITLKGITNAPADPSVDIWRTVTLPLLRLATGLSDGFELKIVKRGAEPLVSSAWHEWAWQGSHTAVGWSKLPAMSVVVAACILV